MNVYMWHPLFLLFPLSAVWLVAVSCTPLRGVYVDPLFSQGSLVPDTIGVFVDALIHDAESDSAANLEYCAIARERIGSVVNSALEDKDYTTRGITVPWFGGFSPAQAAIKVVDRTAGTVRTEKGLLPAPGLPDTVDAVHVPALERELVDRLRGYVDREFSGALRLEMNPNALSELRQLSCGKPVLMILALGMHAPPAEQFMLPLPVPGLLFISTIAHAYIEVHGALINPNDGRVLWAEREGGPLDINDGAEFRWVIERKLLHHFPERMMMRIRHRRYQRQ